MLYFLYTMIQRMLNHEVWNTVWLYLYTIQENRGELLFSNTAIFSIATHPEASVFEIELTRHVSVVSNNAPCDDFLKYMVTTLIINPCAAGTVYIRV